MKTWEQKWSRALPGYITLSGKVQWVQPEKMSSRKKQTAGQHARKMGNSKQKKARIAFSEPSIHINIVTDKK